MELEVYSICQVYVSSSRRGPDGKTVTEQYQSSTVGDADRKLREQQELYANSGTGIDKMALERTMGEQGQREGQLGDCS